MLSQFSFRFPAIATASLRNAGRRLGCGVALVLIGCVGATHAADRVYYRYVNDEGVKVLNAIIPPEYVKNGYEIVTLRGKVLEVVPPAMSDEEKAKIAEQRKREAELAQWDESLLRRYSSVEDIEQAKLRKMHDFDANLSILNANANNFTNQIQQAQARAADAERAGHQVPQAVLNQITSLQNKLSETEQQIEKRKQEKQETAEEYEKDAQRFREIKPNS